MTPEHPKVFISHASEDKDRFVNEFATKLRARGIDAWVDRWEMLPGDSLIDKIFEEGIKNAQAMIVVLSENSVKKRWVREELNAGLVKRIAGKCKIIPIVLDDCEVPEALKSTLWEKIENSNNYDKEFERIISAIYGHSGKHPLGTSPKYTYLQIDNLPGLNRIDTIVFKIICDVSLEIGIDWVGYEALKPHMAELDISEDEVFESIDILAEHYFIKGDRHYGNRGLDFFQITPNGFEHYALVFVPNFNQLVNQVLITIVNLNLYDNNALSSHLGISRVLIDYILDILSIRGLIRTIKTMGGGVDVTETTTRGIRAARSLNGL